MSCPVDGIITAVSATKFHNRKGSVGFGSQNDTKLARNVNVKLGVNNAIPIRTFRHYILGNFLDVAFGNGWLFRLSELYFMIVATTMWRYVVC